MGRNNSPEVMFAVYHPKSFSSMPVLEWNPFLSVFATIGFTFFFAKRRNASIFMTMPLRIFIGFAGIPAFGFQLSTRIVTLRFATIVVAGYRPLDSAAFSTGAFRKNDIFIMSDFHGSQLANPVWGIIQFNPNDAPSNVEINLLYQKGSASLNGNDSRCPSGKPLPENTLPCPSWALTNPFNLLVSPQNSHPP